MYPDPGWTVVAYIRFSIISGVPLEPMKHGWEKTLCSLELIESIQGILAIIVFKFGCKLEQQYY
jgi:hypothetical protein